MKALLVILIWAVLNVHFVYSFQSLRDFKNSKVFINNDQVEVYAAGDVASFFVIGDWGGMPVFPFRTVIEQSISKEMEKQAQIHNTQFQIALGDNFYLSGVKNVDDKRFKETYENVFNTPHVKDTPWFMLLGNHDHIGNISAQIEYSNKSERWIFPSFNYTIDVKINNGNTNLLTVLMIDTILLCGNSGYDIDVGNSPEAGVPTFYSLKEKIFAHEYFKSVESKIRDIGESDIPYFLIGGHYPVWSIAEHGPTDCLLKKLRPLLHKYNVSAYLSGHDHNLQHIETTYLDQTVNYILSGASNFVTDSTKHTSSVPPDSAKFFWGENHELVNGAFCLFKASSHNLTITFIESNGKELYQTIIYPRK